MQVMLILILLNAHYFQNVVFSFEKGSNGQNNLLSDSHHPRFPILPLGDFHPYSFALVKTLKSVVYKFLQNFKIPC